MFIHNISSKHDRETTDRQIFRKTLDGLCFCTCSIDLLFIFLFITCHSIFWQCAALFPYLVPWIHATTEAAYEWSLFSVVCLRLKKKIKSSKKGYQSFACLALLLYVCPQRKFEIHLRLTVMTTTIEVQRFQFSYGRYSREYYLCLSIFYCTFCGNWKAQKHNSFWCPWKRVQAAILDQFHSFKASAPDACKHIPSLVTDVMH